MYVKMGNVKKEGRKGVVWRVSWFFCLACCDFLCKFFVDIFLWTFIGVLAWKRGKKRLKSGKCKKRGREEGAWSLEVSVEAFQGLLKFA